MIGRDGWRGESDPCAPLSFIQFCCIFLDIRSPPSLFFSLKSPSSTLSLSSFVHHELCTHEFVSPFYVKLIYTVTEHTHLSHLMRGG